MLQKLDLGDEKVVAFRWEGVFDQKGFKQFLVQFIPELQMRSSMNLYLEVVNLTEIEARAVWEEVKYDVKNYKELSNKIDKIALVTDLSWMRTLAASSSALIPGIRLKTFKFEESDAAKAFVTENVMPL